MVELINEQFALITHKVSLFSFRNLYYWDDLRKRELRKNMLQKGLILLDDADFDYAVHFKSNVAIIQSEDVIGHGKIFSHTKEAVKVNDGYYLKTVCKFVIE